MYAFPLVIQDHHEGAEANRGCIELEGLGGRGSPSPKGPSPVRLLLGQYRGRRNAWKTAGRGVRGPPRRSAAAVTSICRRSAERPTQRRNRPGSGTVRVVCGRSLACRPAWTPRCWGSPCHCGSETCRRTCSCGPPYPACNVGAPEALPLDDFAQATAEPVPVRSPSRASFSLVNGCSVTSLPTSTGAGLGRSIGTRIASSCGWRMARGSGAASSSQVPESRRPADSLGRGQTAAAAFDRLRSCQLAHHEPRFLIRTL